MQTRSDIAHRLRALRLERGLSQIDLSRLSGLDQRRISAVERASVDPRLETLLVLAAALGAQIAIVPKDDPANRLDASAVASNSPFSDDDDDDEELFVTGVSNIISNLRD